MSLANARKRLANFNAEFTARMEAQRKVEGAALQAAVEAEVWKMYDEGVSIAAIMREYGTKDFGTVKRIIDRRPGNGVSDSADVTVTRDGDVYTVTGYGEKLRFNVDEGVPLFITSDEFYNSAGQLAKHMRTVDDTFIEQIGEL